MRLEGTKTLVTGGGRGIGRAIALALAREGADVAIGELQAAMAEGTVGEVRALGRQGLALGADVRRRDEVEAMVRNTVEAFGRLDAAVNVAGIVIRGNLLEMTDEQWDPVIDTNLKGTFLVGQAAARHMVARGGGGKIVNIASISARIANSAAQYCASKAGAWMLTRCMAAEWAPYHINVNSISPGTVITDINRDYLMSNPDAMQARVSRVAWDRLATPEDIAGAAVFLVSSDSDYITGADIVVDGGTLIR